MSVLGRAARRAQVELVAVVYVCVRSAESCVRLLLLLLRFVAPAVLEHTSRFALRVFGCVYEWPITISPRAYFGRASRRNFDYTHSESV